MKKKQRKVEKKESNFEKKRKKKEMNFELLL